MFIFFVKFLEPTQFKKSNKVKASFNHNKVSEQTWSLNNQMDCHKHYKTLAWSPYSNDSAYFELSMTQKQVSILTSTYTPVTSSETSFYHYTALEQFADLAIEKAR